ncbi:flavodoxin [Clostridium beijerinckii]|nr:flavodoxin [Clostridium beijerinckii]
MKLSIVYHSESGNTEKAAEIIVNIRWKIRRSRYY